MQTQHSISKVSWSQYNSVLRSVRHKVNVLELRTPEKIEFDEKDAKALHALIYQGEHAIACGRLTSTGVISRICVLPCHRGFGFGAKILEALVQFAQHENMTKVSISAKLDTVDFYTQYGFTPHGQVFMQAGLPRQHVVSDINKITFS